MTPHDPTSGPGWSDVSAAVDRIVDDPLTREGAPRGVEPWQITPGAPPVRKARPPRARSLLRDATIHRRILEKSRTTPVPAPTARRREAETSRKPEGHEREFYKPSAPLLTNVVVDRPPPVRKQVDPTWDPAPERVVAPIAEPPPLEADTEEIEQAWFLTTDGTLEPAVERVTLPPGRIAAFLAAGASLGAVALVAVAIGQGSAGSQAEAVSPSVEAILGVPAEDVIDLAADPSVQVGPEATAHEVPAATAIPPRTATKKTKAKPEPVAIPEGSAELWGDIEKTDAPEPIWGEVDQ